MQTTVTLTASAAFGFGGKQYIARITGRDSKFTFAREFVGQKDGKRRECCSFDTDEFGLYMECDIDRKGNKNETFYSVRPDTTEGIVARTISKEKAMQIAKLMDSGKSFLDARAEVCPPKPAIVDPTPAQETSADTDFDPLALGM